MRASEHEYGVRLVCVCMKDFVEDIKSSNILGANRRAMYIRYVTVEEMMIKFQAVSCCWKLNKQDTVPNRFGNLNLDDRRIFLSSEKDIFLII